MATEIIEIKPKLLGITVNVNELWRRLRRELPPASRVAQRFLELFQEHGVAPAQIQRFLPQVTLEHLSPDRLGAVLTNETLDQAATLFGVRREWLEGIDEQVYENLSCYKAPRYFFEDLARWQIKPQTFAVRALCCGELDYTSQQEQPLALVVVESIGSLGDKEVCRYRVYRDAWDWSYLPCRLQLKAFARLMHFGWQTPVPLHRVQRRVLERIHAGRKVPHFELRGCLLTEPSLEDFALSEDESRQAQETDELASVSAYVERHRLGEFSRRWERQASGDQSAPSETPG